VQPYSPAPATVVRDPTDVIGRRIAALVIDWSIAFVMFGVLAVSLASTQEFGTTGQAERACDDINDVANEFCAPVDDTIYVYDDGDLLALTLLPLTYLFLNGALLTGVTGFSIGKGLVGLRVIRQSDGRLCGVGRASLRWLLWIADGAPYCLPVVGLVTGLTTKGHRRVGDIAASTLVVDRRDVGVVPVVPGLNAMAPPPWGPSTWGTPAPAWGPPAAPGYPPQAGPPTAPGYPPQAAPPTWGAPPTSAPPAWGQPAAPPSWGQPPPPTTWGQGTPVQPAPSPAPAPVVRENPGVDSPLWDDARDTYIQWDPDLASWVQWDEAAREWHPIV
jgi:RDD family